MADQLEILQEQAQTSSHVLFHPKIFCNFIRLAAYCFVDAKKKKTKR